MKRNITFHIKRLLRETYSAMPFHTQDKFRGENTKGNRSKDTLRRRFWRENSILDPSLQKKGRRTSAEYTIRRRNLKIPEYLHEKNKYVRGLYHWGNDTKNINNRFMMKVYSSRDHCRIYTGNSQKKRLLKGWFIEHKCRHNNRVYRTFASKKDSIEEDISLDFKKPNTTIPDDVRFNEMIKLYNGLEPFFTSDYYRIRRRYNSNVFVGGFADIIFNNGKIEGFPYQRCSLCDLFTSNINICEDCGGEYPMCSSHKFRSICHVCGLKCRVCNAISSMRFDNNIQSVGWTADYFRFNRRKSIRKYEIIDFCLECKNSLSDLMEDNGVVKVIASMIIEYVD